MENDPSVRRSGVVLSFAGSTDGHLQPAYADQLASFLQAYLAVRPAVPHTWCAQVVRDAAYGDRVLVDHPDVERVSFERDAASADRIFASYASAELVLTNRLHSFLFALSQGALAVVVTDPATHGKIVGIIEEMGLPELLVPLDGLDPGRVAGCGGRARPAAGRRSWPRSASTSTPRPPAWTPCSTSGSGRPAVGVASG